MISIGFAAYSGEPSWDDVETVETLLEAIYSETGFRNIVFMLGGYWGLMKVITDYILDKDGLVILFPPLDLEDIEYPSKAVVLKLGMSMRARSIPLVRSSDYFIAVGGESGSMLEIITSYCEAKPTYLLVGRGYSTDKLAGLTPYFDRRRITCVKVFNDPIALANELLSDMGFVKR